MTTSSTDIFRLVRATNDNIIHMGEGSDTYDLLPFQGGTCYLATDTHLIYIDWEREDEEVGHIEERICLGDKGQTLLENSTIILGKNPNQQDNEMIAVPRKYVDERINQIQGLYKGLVKRIKNSSSTPDPDNPPAGSFLTLSNFDRGHEYIAEDSGIYFYADNTYYEAGTVFLATKKYVNDGSYNKGTDSTYWMAVNPFKNSNQPITNPVTFDQIVTFNDDIVANNSIVSSGISSEEDLSINSNSAINIGLNEDGEIAKIKNNFETTDGYEINLGQNDKSNIQVIYEKEREETGEILQDQINVNGTMYIQEPAGAGLYLNTAESGATPIYRTIPALISAASFSGQVKISAGYAYTGSGSGISTKTDFDNLPGFNTSAIFLQDVFFVAVYATEDKTRILAPWVYSNYSGWKNGFIYFLNNLTCDNSDRKTWARFYPGGSLAYLYYSLQEEGGKKKLTVKYAPSSDSNSYLGTFLDQLYATNIKYNYIAIGI